MSNAINLLWMTYQNLTLQSWEHFEGIGPTTYVMAFNLTVTSGASAWD